VLTPGDLGDSRTRSTYKKSGRCIVYKTGEVNKVTGISLQDLAALPFDRAREVGLNLCREMSDSQLKYFWSVPLSYVRRMRFLLGIEKDQRGTIYVRDGQPDKWPPAFRNAVRSGAGKSVPAQPDHDAPIPQKTAQKTVRTVAPVRQENDALTGFTLNFNGVFQADDLKSKIEAVKALLSGSPGSKYVVDVSLQEIDNGNRSTGALSGIATTMQNISE
jgi:hypothetical protein